MLVIQEEKKGYNAKISGNGNEYITTDDYNKFTKSVNDNSIRSNKLLYTYDIINFITSTQLDRKAAKFATKAELKAEQDKINNQKHLIQVSFQVKFILKIMVHKIV